MSYHADDYKAAGAKVLAFISDHRVTLTWFALGVIFGTITVRLLA